MDYRKLSILYALFQQEYITPIDLAKKIGISHRTLNSEIKLLNAEKMLKTHQIKIQIQRGRGYKIIFPIEYAGYVNQLKSHLHEYFALPVNSLLGGNKRIGWLIRQFLLANGYLKSQELIHVLNISLPTLNKDLRYVRELFRQYNLVIEVTPHYGMVVRGSEMAKQSCLVDFCDIYCYTEESLLFEDCRKQYDIKQEKVIDMHSLLYESCKAYEVTLTEKGFTRMLNYLLIMQTRYKVLETIEPLFEINDEIKNTKLYQLTLELISHIVVDRRYKTTNTLFTYLFLMLLNNQELNEQQHTLFLILHPHLKTLVREKIVEVHKILSFDVVKYEELATSITWMMTKLLSRRQFDVYEYDVSDNVKDKIRPLQASVTFALYLYQVFDLMDSDSLKEYGYFELILTLHTKSSQYQNEYGNLRIAFINDDNQLLADIYQKRLGLDDENVEFFHHYSYELPYLDYQQYDYLFLPKNYYPYQKRKFPIPVYQYDALTKIGRQQLIDEQKIISHRKFRAIADDFGAPLIIRLDATKENLAQSIVDWFVKNGVVFDHIQIEKVIVFVQALLFDVPVQLGDEQRHTNIYILYATKILQKSHFIIDLNECIVLNHKQIKMLHFIFLDLSNGPIMIKNGDSEIYHLMDMYSNVYR